MWTIYRLIGSLIILLSWGLIRNRNFFRFFLCKLWSLIPTNLLTIFLISLTNSPIIQKWSWGLYRNSLRWWLILNCFLVMKGGVDFSFEFTWSYRRIVCFLRSDIIKLASSVGTMLWKPFRFQLWLDLIICTINVTFAVI